MKRTALTLILVSALLISALMLTQCVNLGRGNPYHFPSSSSPDPNPPSINISSPTKSQVFDSRDIWLNFTATKPETWLVGGPYQWDGGVVYTFVGNIVSVQYNLDGVESEKIPANDTGLWEIYPSMPSRNLDISLNLAGLSEGSHELTVSAYGQYQYYNEGAHVDPIVGNSTIEFTIRLSGTANTTRQNEPLSTFQATLVVTASGASAIAIGVGLLIYFKKFKKRE